VVIKRHRLKIYRRPMGACIFLKYKRYLISTAKGLLDSGRRSLPLMKTSSMWGGVFKYKEIYKKPWSA
jgi:hypothetical protein